ncbi:MAG: KpsF/GutQ family sugar-phosphate isomerase [SAR324 cluster bacterium]|nr:KpsF/GutQ family sugar-phosphate isomerase [SAR324 cluster bacterium]MCH8886883.1 KpsF/GutQ family sugar-phosphate isomerase [SAR324 cluster bacterium]
MTASQIDILAELRRALEIEAEGIAGLTGRLDAGFEAAVRLLFECQGKVVVTGMGKSGHVAKKIAATLASTGTRSFFLHPAEAIHGDLGMVESKDVVLAISNSGATGEVVRLLGPFKRIGVKLVAMTGDPRSELARRADFHLDVSVPREACPLDLTPTASTTAALALGDAIAVTLLSLRNFRPEDYAVFHPGGDLGKKLMTTVSDLMEAGRKAPVVDGAVSVAEAVREIQAKDFGITAVTGAEGRLAGSFSLGDLMRLHISQPDLAFMSEPVSGYMTENPRAVTADTLAAQALNTMETHSIRALFVADPERRPVGIIGIYEVLKAIDY